MKNTDNKFGFTDTEITAEQERIRSVIHEQFQLGLDGLEKYGAAPRNDWPATEKSPTQWLEYDDQHQEAIDMLRARAESLGMVWRLVDQLPGCWYQLDNPLIDKIAFCGSGDFTDSAVTLWHKTGQIEHFYHMPADVFQLLLNAPSIGHMREVALTLWPLHEAFRKIATITSESGVDGHLMLEDIKELVGCAYYEFSFFNWNDIWHAWPDRVSYALYSGIDFAGLDEEFGEDEIGYMDDYYLDNLRDDDELDEHEEYQQRFGNEKKFIQQLRKFEKKLVRSGITYRDMLDEILEACSMVGEGWLAEELEKAEVEWKAAQVKKTLDARFPAVKGSQLGKQVAV